MRMARALAIVLALCGASAAGAQTGDTGDIGAGPVAMRITPCLLAARIHQGAPCPEPSLRVGGTASELAADHLARARYFIDLQDLKGADGEIDAALAADPASAQAHHQAARLALTMRNMPRAEHEIAIARTHAPDDLDIHATYAAILEARPAPTEALAELNAVLAKRPDHIYARLKRAAIHMDNGNTLAEFGDLDFLVKFDPRNVQYRAMRADALMKLHRPAAAVADLTAALELAPQQFSLLTARARAYELAGDDRAALADLNVVLGPVGGPPAYAIGGDQYAHYLAQRAMILVHDHRFAEAAADMANAVTSGGRPAILRAQVLLRQNGFPEVPLDGKDSAQLRSAIAACFGLDSCFAAIKRDI
jgi:tetratricopeptide (TPR) repeat protein